MFGILKSGIAAVDVVGCGARGFLELRPAAFNVAVVSNWACCRIAVVAVVVGVVVAGASAVAAADADASVVAAGVEYHGVKMFGIC